MMQSLKEWIKHVSNWISDKDKNLEYGTAIEITSHTSKANAYVFPSDGLVRVQCRYTASNYISVTICNNDGTCENAFQYHAGGTANVNGAVSVFKGQKAWRSGNAGDYNYIYFIPLIRVGG